MTVTAWLAAVLWLGAAGPACAGSTTTLKGVDVYRTQSVTSAQLESLLRHKLEVYVSLYGEARPAAQRSAVRIKKEVEDAVAALGDFAFVDLVAGRYLTSAEQTVYLTLDVVDRKDATARMPFGPVPTGSVPDPDGLLAAWQASAALGSQLRLAGALPFDRPSCGGYYCLWGAQTPELGVYEDRFIKGAPANKAALLKVLDSDGDPAKRAAALCLLGYVREGKVTADLMLGALFDPAREVRSAALQILADIVVYHKDIFIEVHRILPVLDFATVSDRSKALGVLVGLADNKDYRPYLTSRAGPRLLELLKQEQPSVHDLAFTVLGMLSKESFPRRDYKAWGGWVDAQMSTGAASVPLPKP